MDAKEVGDKWAAYAQGLEVVIVNLRAQVKTLELKGGEWTALRARLEKDLEVCRELLAEKDHDIQRASNIITDLKASLLEANQRIVELQQPQLPPEPEPEPEPVPADPVAPLPVAESPVFARMRRTLDENKADAKARHMARSTKARPGRSDQTLTLGENRVLEIRDAVARANWQWAINRALVTRPADLVPPLGRFGATSRVAVEPPPYSTLENVEMGPPYADALRDTKWFVRAYNNRVFSASGITAISPRKPGSQFEPVVSEHGIYAEFSERMRLSDSYFEGFGGHGFYGAYRPMDFQEYFPSNVYATSPMSFEVVRSMFVDMDQMPGRGAFAVQAFNPGDFLHPGVVEIHDAEFYLGWSFVRSQSLWDPVPLVEGFQPQGAGGLEMNCNGAFVVNHYDIERHIERAEAYAAQTGIPRATHPTSLVHIARTTADLSFSRMPMAAIRGSKRVLIEGSAFRADPRHRSPFIWIDDMANQRAIAPAEEVLVEDSLFIDTAVRKVIAPDKFIEAPRDLRGKRALWRTGMTAFEVSAL